MGVDSSAHSGGKSAGGSGTLHGEIQSLAPCQQASLCFPPCVHLLLPSPGWITSMLPGETGAASCKSTHPPLSDTRQKSLGFFHLPQGGKAQTSGDWPS